MYKVVWTSGGLRLRRLFKKLVCHLVDHPGALTHPLGEVGADRYQSASMVCTIVRSFSSLLIWHIPQEKITTCFIRTATFHTLNGLVGWRGSLPSLGVSRIPAGLGLIFSWASETLNILMWKFNDFCLSWNICRKSLKNAQLLVIKL